VVAIALTTSTRCIDHKCQEGGMMTTKITDGLLIKKKTGASKMHICGASTKKNPMAYRNNIGEYSSFPAYLQHRSSKLGKKRKVLKIAFFFRVFFKDPANARQCNCENCQEGQDALSAKPELGTRKSSRTASQRRLA